ncbi:13220_t:CDS:10, partial [Acaulospora colombiana]
NTLKIIQDIHIKWDFLSNRPFPPVPADMNVGNFALFEFSVVARVNIFPCHAARLLSFDDRQRDEEFIVHHNIYSSTYKEDSGLAPITRFPGRSPLQAKTLPVGLDDPDTMSTTQEILPGDTLKRITEENKYMDEFVDWMKRRQYATVDFERDSLEELKALKVSTNPQWSQSGVSPLVSPMLNLLTREIGERQATCETMSIYLEEPSNINSPKEVDKSMIGKYDDLIATCKTHEMCREEASSIKAVKDMQRWHQQDPPKGTRGKWIHFMNDDDLNRFVLPVTERNYRESVVRQQEERLDSHQSRSEEIRTRIARMVTEHSRLLTAVVGHLEAAKNSVHEFSPSSFISHAHDRRESESEHEYMNKAVYVDFSNGKTQPYIIFGTVSQTLTEVRRAMKILQEGKDSFSLGHTRPTKDKALDLEQSLATQPSPQLKRLSQDDIRLLCSFELLSNPPLIPILDEEVKRYGRHNLIFTSNSVNTFNGSTAKYTAHLNAYSLCICSVCCFTPTRLWSFSALLSHLETHQLQRNVYDTRDSSRRHLKTYCSRAPIYGRICGLDEATVTMFVWGVVYVIIEELKAFRRLVSHSPYPYIFQPRLTTDGEVEERQMSCNAMNTYLELINIKSPDSNEEYDDLIAASKTHEGCREEASSAKAVKYMQYWHKQIPNGMKFKYLWSMNDEDLNCFVLPLAERNYRESIVRQQPLARAINTWHQSQLPELLDSHQSHSEEIKTLVASLVTEH